jgi:hypothetical protein
MAQSEEVKYGIVGELHKPARKNFTRRRFYTKGIDDVWQIDLVEMKPYSQNNTGHKYILTVIDVLSKFAWAVPVRDKKAQSVTAAMRKVLQDSAPRRPANIQSDLGREFYNKKFQSLMEEYEINHYSTYTHLKATIVERLNRTLKTWMWKRFSEQGNYKWLKLLPELVDRYNSKVHRTIKMRPKSVRKTHEKKLVSLLNARTVVTKPKFSVNDVVRISKYKTIFEKGFTPAWSTELFVVDRVRNTDPPVYHLRDESGEVIKGTFYESEMQKTKYPGIYLVEKVIRRKGNKSLVKWLGLSSQHNSWI